MPWGDSGAWKVPTKQQQKAAQQRQQDQAGGWGKQYAWRVPPQAHHQGGGGSKPPPVAQPPAPGDPGSLPVPSTDQTPAYKLFSSWLAQYGIPDAPDIEKIIHDAAAGGIKDISLILPDIENTQTFQTRFPGWKARVANGYNQLTVADYLNLEDSYHRILQSAGLPKGFYDHPDDYGNWIANGVSPQEIQSRVNLAVDAANQVNPTAKDLLTKFYGVTTGDLASYFLDQKRSLPVLTKQWNTVDVAQWAARNGLQVQDPKHYEDLVNAGITGDQAAQAYPLVKSLSEAYGKLAGIYGTSYSQSDAENDVLFNQTDKRRKLTAMEQATFSGQSQGQLGKTNRGANY